MLMTGGRPGGGEILLKNKACTYNAFCCNYNSNSLLSYQIMSSPQPSPSQLDPFLIFVVFILTSPFSILSIESYREKKVVESGVSKIFIKWDTGGGARRLM